MLADRVLRPWCAVLLWGALSLAVALYGIHAGFGTRAYFGLLVPLVMLVGGEIWMAAPAIVTATQRVIKPEMSVLLALWPFTAYLVYALELGTLTWRHGAIAAAFSLAPAVLAASASGNKPGAWQDYAAIIAIGVPIKTGLLNVLFPFPRFQLAYLLAVLMGVNAALAAFLFVRRLDGFGYYAGWKRGWGWAYWMPLAMIAAIDIPLGLALRFLSFAPRHDHWWLSALTIPGIVLLTGVPEELLFRGLLQNALGKTLSNEGTGWIVASIIFGFSHIANGHFPNWKYVLLATIAGFFYGYAWRKTRSLFPGALVHGTVDGVWHMLFRTL